MNSLQTSPAASPPPSRIPPRRGFRGNAWVGARGDAEDRSRALTRALAALTALGQMRRARRISSLFSPPRLSLSLSLRATGYVLGRRDPLVTSRANVRSFAATKLYELNGRYTLAPRNLQFTLPRRAAPRRAEPSRASLARSLAREGRRKPEH